MTSCSSTSSTEAPAPAIDRRVSVERLPALFAPYEDQPEQMPAGAPGKVGLLQLRFEARGGRTILASHYATGPQRVQRALYLDPALPGMAFAFIQSVSGGILQGDRLGTEITVSDGAMAHVTTQSATKLYRMERNYATSRLALRVCAGAYLEFLPDYLIPYRNARLYQEIALEVSDDATLVLSDGLAPGRVTHGESFAYDLVFTRLTAVDAGGGLRLTDTVLSQPGRRDPRRAGILGGQSHLGSLYVLTRRTPAAELAERLHACLQGLADADGAASRLPGSDGAVVRVLGDTSHAVQAGLHRAWEAARGSILGVGVPRVHTIKYGREPLARGVALAQEEDAHEHDRSLSPPDHPARGTPRRLDFAGNRPGGVSEQLAHRSDHPGRHLL